MALVADDYHDHKNDYLKVRLFLFVVDDFGNSHLQHDAAVHDVDIDDMVPSIGDSLSQINFYDFDMIVISDYNKGFLTDDDIAKIAFNHPNTICDTKKKLGEWCRGFKVY